MIRRLFLSLICLLLFTACTGTNEPATLTQTAEWQGEHASIVLSLPEGWAWNLFPEKEEDAHLGDGIRFYPEDDPTASVVVRFDNGFGVCGTNLTTEKLTLSGGTQLTSYTWSKEKPSLYRYNGTPGDYLAELQMDDQQRKQYFDTILQILDAAVLGDGIIREETAISRTGHTPSDDNRIYADFDAGRGVWVVKIYSRKTKPETHTFTYEVSADGTSVQTVFQRNREASQ